MTTLSPTRRRFLLTAAGAAVAAQALPAQAARTAAGRVAENTLRSSRDYDDPFRDVEVDVLVEGPDGETQRVPAFWSGDGKWRWRYSSRTPGRYPYRTVASNQSDSGLHDVQGEIEITPYTGTNALYRGGTLRISENRRYFEQADGKPFFWLGDTWWMGLTERLRWPEDFDELAADRAAKGYNVVQLVAGLYPDQASFDPRAANEAGFPWEEGYATINPAWWDLADLRIRRLVDVGLLPCILGCWGYYLNVLGPEKMRAHWRYLIARWGAYPVVWCLAGEGSMPWYLSDRRDAERAELEQGWTEMARYVRATDPFGRLITMHPSRSGRQVVTDDSVLDFDMLQTGHGDYRTIPRTIQQVTAGYALEPTMPVIESEVCYEGIMESCRQDMQRFMFWTTVLNGCCGFTYGANGIWQVNLPGKPFGASPSGRTWGNTPWREAMQAPGGAQVGVSAQVLRELPWHEMTPHREWIDPHWNEDEYHAPSAAGIPGRLRVHYLPTPRQTPTLKQLEPGVRYEATLVDPSSGERHRLGEIVAAADGDYRLPIFPRERDWVLILERS